MKPTCRHCGVELPPPHPGKGRQKQFCSDTCRVKFAYRRKLGVTTNRQRLERMLTTPYATPELEVGDAKWLAAMIDGEGFISLNCHERTRKGNTTAYFFPIVGVSNSHDGLLARVRELVGTRFTAMRYRAATEKHKSVGTTTIARIAMADVLTQIRPYLIAKQRQADIVIEFCGIHDRLPVRTAPLERFEAMFVEMKRLNKRGA